MADKSVGELIAAQSVTPTDLFVLEQNGTAKKLTGQILENWLVSFADGHGGIQSIKKLSTSSLADTYRITLADTTTFDFVVTNGRGITGISKTSTSGLVDTYTIRYNNGTASNFTITNGAKGDKGDNAYTWIKYANQQPTAASHSMGDIPDAWMGIYTGTLAEAPTDWTKYKWYRVRGDQGATGAPATLTGRSVTYMASDSGTVVPSGSWSSDVPTVTRGWYLWTRVVLTFNSGSPVTYYSVSRMGLDGNGAVSTVNGQIPDSTGNVKLTGANITGSSGQSIAAELDAKVDEDALNDAMALRLPLQGGTMTGDIDLGGNALTNVKSPAEDADAATKGYVDKRIVTYQNVSVPASAWASGGTNGGAMRPIHAYVTLSNVTSNMYVSVVFKQDDIEAYNFASTCYVGDGFIEIYAENAPTVAITIPTIICLKV